MRIEFVKPFLQAASKIITKLSGAGIDKGEIYLKPATYTTNEVTVIIGVTGNIKGQIVFSMAYETGKNLATAVLGGFGVEISEEIVESAMSELANMITGNASVELCKAGYECDITPPTLIIGKKTTVSTIDIQTLVVPLCTKLGEIEVNIALKERNHIASLSKAQA